VHAHYVAPDGATFIPASEGFVSGATSWGVKTDPLLRTFGVGAARPGRTFYVTNEHDLRTYAFDVNPDGSLGNPRLFVEEGGECVTTDGNGNVYIAAGQILVFSPDGERVAVIHVPKRPTSLVLGPDGHTLYVTARDALYAVILGE
jgi:sugar lactone lactonase YvrE